MTAGPKISVVTACYNHGKYIQEMIDSMINQTFTDFEMIIVNDGSTDDTKAILDSVKNEKIHVIHTNHRGPSIARNTAIDEAKADIIFNLDADDKIASDFLQKAYDVMISNHNAGIVYPECIFFGYRSGSLNVGEYSLKNMLKSNRIVSAACFRRSDWRVAGGYSDAFIYGLEDWDLWLSIIELGREVVKIPDSRIFYRTYERSAESRSGRRKSDRMKALWSLLLIFERHKELYSGYPSIERRFARIEERYKNEGAYSRNLKNKVFRIKQKLHYLLN